MRLLLSALSLAFSLSIVSGEERPNIVFMVADDLGQRDLGCYGSTFYETPNIDQLAAEGMLFTDAYAACPVCSPTRASLMSGWWPQRTGITDYIGTVFSPDQWKRNTKLLPASNADRLDLEVTTFAESLKEAGYTTFFAGKWHLGPEGWWPQNQGFDINKGGYERGAPAGGKRYFSPYGNPSLTDGPEGEYLPLRLAQETTRFLEQQSKDEPFLVYLPFYSVHTPLMTREDLQLKYEKKRARLGLEEQWGIEGEREVRLSQDHAIYAGMVEAMDIAVGMVLQKLDELDLRENTLVIFTSDNGGLSTSEGSPTSNAPLRAGKGWMYEGGIREPLIVRLPSMIKAGSISSTPVSSPDFFPTFLEIVGQEKSPLLQLDGLSLVPLFKGETLPERALYWHYPHYGNQGGAPAAAIRRGHHKLIHWYEGDEYELFDLKRDLGEQNNLAAERPDLVEMLKAELLEWQIEVGAQMPTINPNYDETQVSGRSVAGKKR